MPDVEELAFSSVDQINDAINNSAPALPDESNNERNWQIWSIANNSRVDSGQPAYCKIYTGVASYSSLTNTADGDICIQTNWDVYQKISGSWTSLGNIKGTTGDAAQIVGATATIDNNVGVPAVNVTATGTPDAQSFEFDFTNMKGEQGDAAGFGTPTASAVTLAAGAPASVSISSSGDDTAKVFSFTFGIPQGVQGAQGIPGTGNNWYVGSAITGTATTPTIYAATGIGDALVGDMYLNSDYSDETYLGNLYRCTTAGDYTVAKWVYVCNIRGASGAGTGDMTKAQYDPTNSGSVLDSLKLGGELPSYYQVNTNGLTATTSFVDGNYIPLYVTASTSNAKISVANIKAALKDYFDTLYITNADVTSAIDAAWWLSTTHVALSVSHLSETVSVIGHSVNGISATSSDSTKASVAVHGDSLTIYAEGSGSATITVTDTQSMTTKTIAVTCTSVPSAVLEDNLPADMAAAARAGIASQLWDVGDRTSVTLNGTIGTLTLSSYKRYAYIIGFDHNAAIEGANTIHFMFGFTALTGGTDIAFCDSGYDGTASSGFVMNTTATNAGGWAASYMRNTICPQFLAAMSSLWQEAIVPCTKYTDNVGGTSGTPADVSPTADRIFLLSQFEVTGTTSQYINPSEETAQMQYAYYANGNSKIKYKHNATSTAAKWWTRSLRYGAGTGFRYVNTTAAINAGNANTSYGIAPAFVIA